MTDRIYFSPASIIQTRFGLGRLTRWIGIGAIAAGAIQALACAVVLVRTSAWISQTTSVAEVVRFRDADGIERRFTSWIATSHPFALDAPVTVRDRPEAPDDATVDAFFRARGLPLVFAGAGLLMMGFRVVLLRVGRRAVHA